MKIQVSFDISEDDRRAIARYLGRRAPATKEQITNFIFGRILSDLHDLREESERYAD